MHPRSLLIPVAAAALALAPATAEAFCGFYIDAGGKQMFNDATQVVLMRSGTRTVLSMRNAYRGPVEDFAMVVPVPVVLQEADVKTLPEDVFDRVEGMGAPRLVEYWEQDPCYVEPPRRYRATAKPSAMKSARADDAEPAPDLGVTVEAQFDVGEYQVVILSAKESTGLDTWLRQENYKIPDKAEAALRPYVEAGSKFFVAKVDPAKVTFQGKRAMLSPLRFHYDTEEFSLPVRLGLINSAGKQDLIVNILAPGQRYEVANYKNVTIPTNLEVTDATRKRFGEFYAALFDRTLEKNPGAVVTEYAWDASTCDPCPGPALTGGDFATLGADVLGGADAAPRGRGRGRGWGGGFVLTRLHARYGAADMKDDLVFAAAAPIVGGREHLQDNGRLEERSTPSDYNNFQGRYIIRHRWTGPIECKNPVRGRWGGPPDGRDEQLMAARDLAFVPRGKVKLTRLLRQSVPEIGLKLPRKKRKKAVKPVPAEQPAAPTAPTPAPAGPRSGALQPAPLPATGMAAGLGGAVVVVAGAIRLRRRRRLPEL